MIHQMNRLLSRYDEKFSAFLSGGALLNGQFYSNDLVNQKLLKIPIDDYRKFAV
jgi:hypothetical protein